MSNTALAVIRPFVKLSSRVAPRLTGNIAFKVFCRPPRPRNFDETQKKMITRAEERIANAEAVRVPFKEGTVQAYCFRTSEQRSRGSILLVHGWTGRAAFMSAFVEPLLMLGFDVVAVDLPAHGRSSGKKLHLPMAVAALYAIHEKLGPFYSVVGHSFGCAVVVSLLCGAVAGTPAMPTNKIILIASPHSMPVIFKQFGTFVGLGPQAQLQLESHVLRLSGRALETFEGEDMLRELGIPTLVLHAPEDKEVSFKSAEALASAGSHVTLQPMPGLGHRRILYAPKTVQSAVAFIDAV
jgi:pimeloyl-ACP methyl ester carboxylesterase